MTEKNAPARPVESHNEIHPGLTAVEHAALELRVPMSENPWLDAMIREARRWDMATAAMQGHFAAGVRIEALIDESLPWNAADALIAELEKGGEKDTPQAVPDEGLLKWDVEYDDNDNSIWVARSAVCDEDNSYRWRVTQFLLDNQIAYSLDSSDAELIMGDQGESYDELSVACEIAEEREREFRKEGGE